MKRVILIIAIVIVIIAILSIIILKNTSAIFIVESKDDGCILVTAKKADEKSSGIGCITLKEGQKLEVRSNLKDNDSIKIEVLPDSIDSITTILKEETFKGIDVRELELKAGDYIIRISAGKNATGTVDIKAK